MTAPAKKENRLDPVLYCDDPSLTRQSEADSCDINKIVSMYDKTGSFPQVPNGLYLDVTQIPDYRTAWDQINQANAFFNSLSAATRARFSTILPNSSTGSTSTTPRAKNSWRSASSPIRPRPTTSGRRLRLPEPLLSSLLWLQRHNRGLTDTTTVELHV